MDQQNTLSKSDPILLTGCAGFIGHHTAAHLIAQGHRVVGLDNCNNYYDPKIKHKNLELLRGMKGDFSCEIGDIRDTALVSRMFKTHKPATVIHLAAMAGVRASIDDPTLYTDVNVTGTMNILNQAVLHDAQHVVFASTSAVYGNTTTIPFTEDDIGIMPVSPYGASKLATEHLGSCWNYVHGINTTALRFFTVYGPRGRPDMMMLHLLNSILTGNEVPYHNGGEMYRDWTYIADIVDGIVRAAARPDGFQVYNLGRGEPVRLGDVVEMLRALTDRSPNLRPIPMPKVDIFKTHADISRARTHLGYAPSVSVTEGLEAIVEWFCREHPEIKTKAS